MYKQGISSLAHGTAKLQISHHMLKLEIRRSGYQELPILQYLLLGSYLAFEPQVVTVADQIEGTCLPNLELHHY
jgi:hypothetical protein